MAKQSTAVEKRKVGSPGLEVNRGLGGRLVAPKRRAPGLTNPDKSFSRHYVDQRVPSRLTRWLRAQDPVLARSVRRAITLALLAPLLLLIATRLPRLVSDPFLTAYGVAILLFTSGLMYLAFVRYRDPVLDAPPLPVASQPDVTVLIAVKNEVHQIEHCLRSVLNQSYENLEIVVVDDASDDGTSEVLDVLAATEPLTVIHLPDNIGKKRALTMGARSARGEFLVFSDSDCYLANDAIERCIRAMINEPDLGALSGHGRALNADASWLTRAQDVWYDTQFGITKAAESSVGSVSCVSGPLAVFRREAIISFLPAWAGDKFAGEEFRFATDRQLTAYVLGQRWIGDKIKRPYADDPLVADSESSDRFWRVGYAKSARVWTNVPETTGAFLRQQIRWKKSFIRNLFFNGPFYWRRGPVPAFMYYGHAIWVLAAPLMVFRHLVWAPLSGAWSLLFLYLAGVTLKGAIWSVAHRIQEPDSRYWWLRIAMSLASSLLLSWLIIYSALTIRRSIWHRDPAPAGSVVVEVVLDDRDPTPPAESSLPESDISRLKRRPVLDLVAGLLLAALFVLVLTGGWLPWSAA